MTAILSRQEILNTLQADWATYVARFQRLSPEAQDVFLANQGYPHFAGLLSHIAAWWEVGYQVVERLLTDPEYPRESYDVDAFNAAAVAKVSGIEEKQVFESFEKTRSFLCAFVNTLPEAAFENEKIVNQLNMEVIGHLSEHNIPKKESSTAENSAD